MELQTNRNNMQEIPLKKFSELGIQVEHDLL